MKFTAKVIASVFVASLIVLSSSFVFAESKKDNGQNRVEQGQSNRSAQAQERKDAREATRSSNQEKIASRRAETQQKRVVHIKEVFGKILTRYEAVLSRFEKFFGRIDSRIAKLKAKGVDTSKAENSEAAAKTQYEVAKKAVADAKTKVAAIDPATTQKEAVLEALDALKSAKRELQAVHKALAKTVVELKAASDLRNSTNSASLSATP